MSRATMTYFDGRGLGEIIRFMMSAAGIKFDEVYLTKREEMLKLISDGLLDFNQVPMVCIDGLRLVQRGSIVRYVAKKGGLYGKDDKEAALIDKFYEGSRDFNDGYLFLHFRDQDAVLGPVKEKLLPRYLPAFDKALRKNNTGYLVGSSLSMADVGLFEVICNTIEFIGPDSIKDYPNIQQFYKTVSDLPRISEFLNGPQRKHANDDEYVTTVKKVLAWKHI